MKKYAVFLDLDGTLLTTDKRLTERTRRALELAHSRGAYIVPTTGRLYEGLPEAVRALDFVEYAVTVNGAEVYDVLNARALTREEITAARALEIFRELEGYDAIYDCYAGGWGYMERKSYLLAEEYVIDPFMLRMVKELRKPVDGLAEYVTERFSSVQKIQMFFKDLRVNAEAVRELRQRLPGENVTSSIRGNLEINAKRANKGDALRFLCGYLGIPRENSIAFGDGSNDLTMIMAAGTGVCMKNATAEVRAAADSMTDTNDRDGVAAFLEEFFG